LSEFFQNGIGVALANNSKTSHVAKNLQKTRRIECDDICQKNLLEKNTANFSGLPNFQLVPAGSTKEWKSNQAYSEPPWWLKDQKTWFFRKTIR